MIKWLVAFFAVVIFYCLGSAGYALVRARDGVVIQRSLGWRVVVSIVLFLFILLSYYAGWLHPRPAKFMLKLELAQQQLAQNPHQTISREEQHGGASS